jgi:hypothetical protein
MYTRENFEYCWGSWFGSYSEYILYSIFTNALKQARRIQRDYCDEVYDEDDCNDAGPRTVVWDALAPCSGSRQVDSKGKDKKRG